MHLLGDRLRAVARRNRRSHACGGVLSRRRSTDRIGVRSVTARLFHGHIMAPATPRAKWGAARICGVRQC
jgi:hypothetical protein